MAWISLVGLYTFDNTIFDGLLLPNGVERDALLFELLAETAELELLYPDADFLKIAIEKWSINSRTSWERLYNSFIIEYNPIENYDRKEEFKDIGHAVSRVAAFNESELTPAGDGDTVADRTGRIHGNIGVTTTQQMLKEERAIATQKFSDIFISEFKKRFCILIY